MSAVKSARLVQTYSNCRPITTNNGGSRNKMYGKPKNKQTSFLEIDHYQNALKRGFIYTERQKIQREKRNYFNKSWKYVSGNQT